jgi:hypothetical protein
MTRQEARHEDQTASAKLANEKNRRAPMNAQISVMRPMKTRGNRLPDLYDFLNVKAGAYDVAVEHDGFSKFTTDSLPGMPYRGPPVAWRPLCCAILRTQPREPG